MNGKEYFRLAFAGALLLVASLGTISRVEAQSDLPQGPGRAVLERMCTTCHGLNVVTGQRMTKKGWADQVDDMVARGAVGSSDDIRQLVDYLAANFAKDQPTSKAAVPEPTVARPRTPEIPPQSSSPNGSLIAEGQGVTESRAPPEGQPGTLELVDLRRNLPKSSPQRSH